jgi:hypothetical protein
VNDYGCGKSGTRGIAPSALLAKIIPNYSIYDYLPDDSHLTATHGKPALINTSKLNHTLQHFKNTKPHCLGLEYESRRYEAGSVKVTYGPETTRLLENSIDSIDYSLMSAINFKKNRSNSSYRTYTRNTDTKGSTQKCCQCRHEASLDHYIPHRRVTQGVQVSPPKVFNDKGMQTSIQVFNGSSILDNLEESMDKSSLQFFIGRTINSECTISPLKAARRTIGFRKEMMSKGYSNNDQCDTEFKESTTSDLLPASELARDNDKVSTETNISNLNMLIESLSADRNNNPHEDFKNIEDNYKQKPVHRTKNSIVPVMKQSPHKENSLAEQANSSLYQDKVGQEIKLSNNSMQSFRVGGHVPLSFTSGHQVQVSMETATFNVSSQGSRSSASPSSCVSHRDAVQIKGERYHVPKEDAKSRTVHHAQCSTIEEEISEASKLSLYHTKTSSETSEKTHPIKESISKEMVSPKRSTMGKKSEVLAELLGGVMQVNRQRRNVGIACKETLDLLSSGNYTSDLNLSKTISEATELKNSQEHNENIDPLL